MKNYFKAVAVVALALFLNACEKDEGKLPKISFVSENGAIFTDTALVANSAFTVSIKAEKTEKKDVLKKFNISKSYNGGTNVTILDSNLSGAQGDNFQFATAYLTDSIVGVNSKYTFTVTNRDGLVNQVLFTITAK